jgi:hypothetical protein
MKKVLVVLAVLVAALHGDVPLLTTLLSEQSRSVAAQRSVGIRVKVDAALLKKERSVAVVLPGNRVLQFDNTHFFSRSSGDYSWAGRPSDGTQNAQALFTTKGGATYGVIFYEGRRYVLKRAEDGNYSITEEQLPDVGRVNDALKPAPRKAVEPEGSESTSSQNSSAREGARLERGTGRAAAAAETTAYFDVMVLYTQAYADYYGSGLSAKIQASIDFGNIALQNNGLQARFRLAYQALYDTAETNENVSIESALKRISGRRDDYSLDASINADIRLLASQHAIDIVTLFRLNTAGGVVGLGWLAYDDAPLSMRRVAYNVSEFDDITFAHESGHNLGCGHSRDVDDCSGALRPYACGYNDDANGFGTIMSYNYNAIQYYATPDAQHQHEGHPIGTVNDDCARNIDEVKAVAARNDDVTETNEAGDARAGGTISGTLDDVYDRDFFPVDLGGSTTISMSNSRYSNVAFYANIYDERGYLLQSINASSEILVLDNGHYFIIPTVEDDMTSQYYNIGGAIDYVIDIATNYVDPGASSSSIAASSSSAVSSSSLSSSAASSAASSSDGGTSSSASSSTAAGSSSSSSSSSASACPDGYYLQQGTSQCIAGVQHDYPQSYPPKTQCQTGTYLQQGSGTCVAAP